MIYDSARRFRLHGRELSEENYDAEFGRENVE